MKRRTPYILTGIGLLIGLVIILSEPFSEPRVNYFVGGTFLSLAGGSITYMIVEFSGPDERRPDF
ncbi:MAG: hypothetical protein ABEI27_14540 [Halobellus sp.]|uniref:hypothetical protein n=1 Tax=Halobellus sp. TaxID=1979212 RepID=UPI0035D52282